jgi:hypothetical protein
MPQTEAQPMHSALPAEYARLRESFDHSASVDRLADSLWSVIGRRYDLPLLAAAVICEASGRALASPFARDAFEAGWLQEQLASCVTEVPDLGPDVIVSVPGDGFEREVHARLSGSDRWDVWAELDLVSPQAPARALLLGTQSPGGEAVLLFVDFGSAEVEMTDRDCVDPDVHCTRVVVQGRGAPLVVGESARRMMAQLVAVARLLIAAEMTGAADAAVRCAVAHVREREQFGRRVADFQAVRHACADAHCSVELSRSLVYAAAGRVRGPDAPSEGDAAMAKLLAGRVLPAVADRATQALGGLGVAWGSETAKATRRIVFLRGLHGDRSECADAVIEGWTAARN